MTQSVKHLLCKPDKWSLIPGTHVKADKRPDSTRCLLAHAHMHTHAHAHTHTSTLKTTTVILKENREMTQSLRTLTTDGHGGICL